MTTTEIREEFNKKFVDPFPAVDSDGNGLIKRHVSSSKDVADWWLSLRDKELTELEEEIDGMMKIAKTTKQFMDKCEYNDALSDVLALIKALREK